MPILFYILLFGTIGVMLTVLFITNWQIRKLHDKDRD